MIGSPLNPLMITPGTKPNVNGESFAIRMMAAANCANRQAPGTIGRFPRDPPEVRIAWGSAVDGKQIRFQYESLTAELCLGMAVAGVSTLIGIGLVIVFA
jgi:hypothetical protein